MKRKKPNNTSNQATRKQQSSPEQRPTRWKILVGVAIIGIAIAIFVSRGHTEPDASGSGGIVFHDVKSQTREFMGWEREIQLDSRQEEIKKAALTTIPAACCSDKTAYTCCCPCNMSKTVWGLANYMISEQGAEASAVRAKVKEWMVYINPSGYSGKACYTGRCGRPFRQDGCGGMTPSQLVF